MNYQQFNPQVEIQLAANRESLLLRAYGQARLDEIRAEAVVRSMARNDAVRADGAMRNAILGAVLPAAMAAEETRRQRRSRR